MKYVSERVISFSLLVNGTDRRIRFVPVTRGGSVYVTDNEGEMKALEASPMFGTTYRRAESAGCAKERKAKPAARKTAVNGVETWQEAIEFMVDQYGAERGRLTTPDEILQEAGRLNLTFPNIK